MNNQKILRLSQTLRKTMTKEERHLWYDFLKTYPVQFKRQYPIGGYIVDFYCYQAKLIIELDGSQHYDPENIEYDKKRTDYITAQGYSVIRFTNRDITERFRPVCEAIDNAVTQKLRD